MAAIDPKLATVRLQRIRRRTLGKVEAAGLRQEHARLLKDEVHQEVPRRSSTTTVLPQRGQVSQLRLRTYDTSFGVGTGLASSGTPQQGQDALAWARQVRRRSASSDEEKVARVNESLARGVICDCAPKRPAIPSERQDRGTADL